MIDGMKVRSRRVAAGLSQWELAVAAGLDQSRVSAIERNKEQHHNYTVETLLKLSGALHCRADDLLFDGAAEETS